MQIAVQRPCGYVVKSITLFDVSGSNSSCSEITMIYSCCGQINRFALINQWDFASFLAGKEHTVAFQFPTPLSAPFLRNYARMSHVLNMDLFLFE